MQTPLQLPSSLGRLHSLLPEVFTPTSRTGELFLRFQLGQNVNAAISLERIVETMRLPAPRITPMPNMSSHVLGLLSSKGQVFWTVNLVQLLNLPVVLEPSQYYEVVVIRTLSVETAQGAMGSQGDMFLGLVVPKIRGSIRLSLEDIVSPMNEVQAGLQPYLSGQVVVDGQSILVLSAEAIGTSQMPTSD